MSGKLIWPVFAVIVSACASAGPDQEPAENSDPVATSDAAMEGSDTDRADSGSGSGLLDAATSAPEPSADATVTPMTGFPKGEGVKTAVDRSAPCATGEQGMFRNAPEDQATIQACLPNYGIWAAVACGGPQPPCTCDPSRCANGEVAKVVSESFCVCMSPCSTQLNKAACGVGATRKCIPVNDTTNTQVFICGGP